MAYLKKDITAAIRLYGKMPCYLTGELNNQLDNCAPGELRSQIHMTGPEASRQNLMDVLHIIRIQEQMPRQSMYC